MLPHTGLLYYSCLKSVSAYHIWLHVLPQICNHIIIVLCCGGGGSGFTPGLPADIMCCIGEVVVSVMCVGAGGVRGGENLVNFTVVGSVCC